MHAIVSSALPNAIGSCGSELRPRPRKARTPPILSSYLRFDRRHRILGTVHGSHRDRPNARVRDTPALQAKAANSIRADSSSVARSVSTWRWRPWREVATPAGLADSVRCRIFASGHDAGGLDSSRQQCGCHCCILAMSSLRKILGPVTMDYLLPEVQCPVQSAARARRPPLGCPQR